MKKLLPKLALAGISLAFVSVANAQDNFPAKPITLVNPYAPGGPVSALARLLAKGLGDTLKQAVIVLDKGGAGAAIGAAFVAKSDPDGYTLLLGTAAAHYITPYMTPQPYDGLKDFTFIGMVDNAANMLVVNPSVKANNLKEFIALAKAQPGKLNYGTSGSGTSPHIGMEMLEQQVGIDLVHVPYRGAAPALVDIAAGQVQAGLINMSGVLPFLKSGTLRPLAYAASARAKTAPNVPTFAEAGLPGFASGSWHSLAAPAGTPLAIVDRLAKALVAVQESPEFIAGLEAQGTDPFMLGPQETSKFITEEAQRTLAMFKSSNIQLK